jgi:AbrB family looped-hinge helix DNA binding protein
MRRHLALFDHEPGSAEKRPSTRAAQPRTAIVDFTVLPSQHGSTVFNSILTTGQDKAMASGRTTITRKGQITIPIEIRRELDLNEGDKLSVENQGGKIVLVRALSVTERTAGALKAYAIQPPPTPEEMRAAFEQAVANEVAGID